MAKPKPQDRSQQMATLAEGAVKMAIHLIDTWDKAMRPRLNTIQEYEENYFGKVRPRSTGRSNFPVPVMARYIDEIYARLDESPSLKYDSSVSVSKKLIAKKATGVVHDLKKPSKGNWSANDRMSSNFGLFAGYNAVDFYSETVNGKFGLCFDPIDHNEFIFQVGGGADLGKHAGVGRFPIWRTKGALQARADAGFYDPDQVKKLISLQGSEFKKNDEYFRNKNTRYKTLGIDIENNDYVGQPVYPVASMQLTLDDGKRYVLTFDYRSGVWLRFMPLESVYPSGMYSIDLWQTHEDPASVACKSILDDIYPLAEGVRLKVNQLFDNHTQRVYGMTGYDPNYVPDPSQLIWKQQGQLVRMKSFGGKPVSQGIHRFQTDDMTDATMKFVEWMENFLTSVVGINPQDVSSEVQKVGILFGQIQKASARLGIYNKSKHDMWERMGVRALHEMAEFMSEPQVIQIIGTKGAEWHEFSGEEIDDPADFDVLVEGSNVELEMSEARKKRQKEVMGDIVKDPDLKKELNARKTVEVMLKTGEFDDDTVRALMDTAHYGNEEMLARADLACLEIMKGKTPNLYPGADVAFMSYILDYANNLDEAEAVKRVILLEYGRAHKQIVVKNQIQKAAEQIADRGGDPTKMNLPPHMMPPGLAQATPSAPGPRAPSAGMAAKVKARGVRPLGHMPIPSVPTRRPSGVPVAAPTPTP